jgi:hypothetical protein
MFSVWHGFTRCAARDRIDRFLGGPRGQTRREFREVARGTQPIALRQPNTQATELVQLRERGHVLGDHLGSALGRRGNGRRDDRVAGAVEVDPVRDADRKSVV